MNIMKKNNGIILAALLVGLTALSSCEVMGDLMEFGVWIGIIIVVAVVALIWWIIRKFKR